MNETRKQHWEDVYLNKLPTEVSWYQAEPRLSLELIAGTGIDLDAAIIDVGGGASVLVDRLHDAGYRDLSVLDISARALEVARQRMGDAATDVHWIDSDITEFNPPQSYVLWHDRAVFHFLTDAGDRQRYVDVLRRAVPAGGHVIMAAFAIGGPIRCSGLEIVQYDAPHMQAELGTGFELVEQRDETHRTPAGGDQLFSFFRFRRLA